MATFVVSNEAALWQLLERALENPDEESVLHIAGWRPELLYFPDEATGRTVSPSIARALSGYHAQLARAYAMLAYGRPDGRLLKADDLENLDIKILVVEGSTGFNVLEEALDQLIKGLVGKMSGKQVTLAVIILLLLYFSATVAKDWIAKSYEEKKHELDVRERIELSDQETARIKLITEAMQKKPDLQGLSKLSSDSKEPLVRGVISAGRARVMGTAISGDQARVIVSKQRERGDGKRLDGDYEVVDINVENPVGYMGRVRDIATKQEFAVSINYSDLPQQDIDVLFKSVAEKRSVHLMINAWFVGDKIASASIVRADDGD